MRVARPSQLTLHAWPCPSNSLNPTTPLGGRMETPRPREANGLCQGHTQGTLESWGLTRQS